MTCAPLFVADLPDNDVVFEMNLGKNVANAMLGELLDVVSRSPAANHDPLGEQLEFEVLYAATRASKDPRFQFPS